MANTLTSPSANAQPSNLEHRLTMYMYFLLTPKRVFLRYPARPQVMPVFAGGAAIGRLAGELGLAAGLATATGVDVRITHPAHSTQYATHLNAGIPIPIHHKLNR